MKRLTSESLCLADLANVFLPESPIKDGSDLVGREASLKAILSKLSGDSSAVPVLVGPPGIGKTSILNIVKDVLLGFEEDLGSLGLSAFAPPRINRMVIGFSCSSDVEGEAELSLRILSLLRSIQADPDRRQTMRLKEATIELSVGPLGAEAVFDRIAISEAPATQALGEFINDYAYESDGEVVIVLDECEQLDWLSELLAYIHRFPQSSVRFILAMRDYAEIRLRSGRDGDYRWPSDVLVTRWRETEIREFYEGIANKLASIGVTWVTDPTAISRIHRLSAGEPWYCQMIGYEVLMRQASKLLDGTGDRTVRVTGDELNHAESELIKSRLRGAYTHQYALVAAGAPRREELLRAMASYPDTLIPLNFVTFAAGGWIKTARSIVSKMVEWEPEPLLLRVEGPVVYYQFVSHQFRVYSRLVDASSSEIDSRVRGLHESWERMLADRNRSV